MLAAAIMLPKVKLYRGPVCSDCSHSTSVQIAALTVFNPLPSPARAPAPPPNSQVRCEQAGPPPKVLTVSTEPIPSELEWGQVLVSMRAVPINPADLYTVQVGVCDFLLGGVCGGGDAVCVPGCVVCVRALVC